jgi:acyl carrier protein
MNNISGRVANCFANVFPEIGPDEIPKASTVSLAAWDSVAHITLLSAISEEFALELAPEDFEELTSYALIVNHIESQPPQ